MCEWTDYIGAKFKSLTQLHLPPISNSESHLPPCERFEFADNEMLETFLKVWNQLILTGLLSGRWMCSINSARKEINYFQKMHFPVIFTTIQTSVSSTPNLSRFVVETRKTDGSKYPPATIHQLLYGVLKHKREVNLDCINFLNKTPDLSNYMELWTCFSTDCIQRDWVQRWRVHVLTKEDEQKLCEVEFWASIHKKCSKMLIFFNCGKDVFSSWRCGASSTQVISTEVNG